MKTIIGKKINLRDIEITDAEFILNLRLNEIKSKYLHKVDNDLSKQVDFIKNYKTSNNSFYFIIENKNKDKIGTVRIYDIQESSFCWGSWIIIDGAINSAAIESALLIYEFGFLKLGFTSSHFDVRKKNKKVRAFHERMGAKKISDNEIDVFYRYHLEDYLKIREKYKKFLP